MSYLKKITTLSLGLGFMISSCSQQEPMASIVEPSTIVNGKQAEKTEVISLSINAGFGLKDSDNTTRALQGSTFYRGRLRPYIIDNRVDVTVYLGSTTSGQFSSETLSFEYDKKTNSIHYRGNISVPQDLLQASDLKMFLVAANAQRLNGSTLTMQDVNTEVFVNKEFADDETLTIDAPYFSDWIAVNTYVDGDKLDVARTKVTMKPQGHIIKLQLGSSITALSNVYLTAIQLESTAISENGSYTLPTSSNDIDKMPVFTPEFTDPNTKFRKITLPVNEVVLDNNITRTVYLWVENTPDAPADKWTRAFAKVKYNKPYISLEYTRDNPWWSGLNGKTIPLYYTNSSFEATGSTMNMLIDNIKISSPLDRTGPSSYIAGAFSDVNYGYIDENDPNVNNKTPKFGPHFRDREYSNFTRYTWPYLAGKNWVGDNVDPINVPSQDINSKNGNFYIPTLDEFRALFPTDSRVAPLFNLTFGYSNNNDVSVEERVKVGNRNSAPSQYTSTYRYVGNFEAAGKAVRAIRFKGGNNKYKSIYLYRELQINNGTNSRIQLQSYHLGEFFPEINTISDFEAFKAKYPQATHHGHTTERMMPTDRAEANNAIRYWVNNPSNGNATSIYYNYSNGTIQERTSPVGDKNVAATVLVLRDLK